LQLKTLITLESMKGNGSRPAFVLLVATLLVFFGSSAAQSPCMVAALLILFGTSAAQSPGSDWSAYGHDAGGTRYSPLTQINRSNVQQLKPAWTYHTGALQPASDLNKKAAFESTPILADGRLYLSTPFDQVIALDPATGKELWKFDPQINRSNDYSEVTSRGVSAWSDPQARANDPCRLRIFIGTIDGRLLAIDGRSGKLCGDFGAQGQVDLTRDVELRDRGQYQVTSPAVVTKDLVIVGSSIGDNRAVDLERGIVRAFNARTGALRWTWDPIPWAMKTTPRTGAGNAWSVFALDSEHDLVFVPTSSASPDFFGGIRKGDGKYANSVVALRASSGEFVWGFQVVHHDLWDYDVASQPTLFTWQGKTPAIAITTKMGHIFVLNRLTGAPLQKVEEKPVPKSDVPGEEASPTQPFSAIEPVVPQKLTAEEAWGKSVEDREWCSKRIAASRSEGIFTPPSLQGTIAFPGNVGGVNWGSAALDPARHLLIMNTNRLPFWVKMIPQDKLHDEYTQHEHAGDRLHGEYGRQRGAPYAMYREPLLSPSGLPCNPPPWGTTTAVDLESGKKLWETPLGSMAPGMNTGSPNLGGPMATAGGLVFTAAAMDTYLRAFDIESGKELWKAELPASAQATPMTYSVNGKQYIVIAAGGHGKLGTRQGDAVIAYTVTDR
jgi:quinoprotein glucose dehydrogenase